MGDAPKPDPAIVEMRRRAAEAVAKVTDERTRQMIAEALAPILDRLDALERELAEVKRRQ